MRRVLIQEADFDAGAELGALGALGAGGVASFVGHVRGDGGLISLTLEHYPAMTSASLEVLAAEAESRWPLLGVVIIHRVGRLVPGDQIVLAAAASAHRAAALEACALLIDRLKTDAPFWKKEAFASGRERWVEARETDEAAATRWG
jgi:molybdopterin synthase catalytic subunit